MKFLKLTPRDLEKLLFYGIVLLLPSQLGKHFWSSFSFVEGIRIDYLSPTLYLTDILILLLFIIFITDRNGSHKKAITNYQLPITLFLLFLIFGILQSISPIAGLYKLIKIFEFGFFGFYIATTVNWKKDFPTIAALLSIGIIFESFVATLQFINQSSIGGMFWFFGERTFSGQTPGIANAIIDGRLTLRPYGTFPHPNVLAGYLVIIMTMIVLSIKYQVLGIKKMLFVGSVIVGTMALFLTLSRIAIILWLVVLGVWLFMYARQASKKTLLTLNSQLSFFLLVVLVFIGSIGIIHFTPLPSRFTSLADADKQSVIRRQQLNVVAIGMFQKFPIFGVGLNNFLVNLPNFQKPASGPLWLQPVHNIYLLILAETGVVGFMFFLWFVGRTYIRIRNQAARGFLIHNSKFIILSMVLFLGMFDHYFLTLQQGQLLSAFVFGIILTKNR